MNQYLVGMTKSEAIDYINALDISENEREEMLKDAQRQPVTRPQEQMYRLASENDDKHRLYVERLSAVIQRLGGSTNAETLKRELGMNGSRLTGVLRRAVAEGDFIRRPNGIGRYVYEVKK